MKLILFLGSGVSLESQLPTTKRLTEDILYPGIATNESIFLNALNEYDQKAKLVYGDIYNKKYSKGGQIYRRSSSYEDLYYLCEEINSFHVGLHTSAMVPGFIDSLQKSLLPILKESIKRKKLYEIGRNAHDAKNYINKSILASLATPKKIVGLELIVQLARNPNITSLEIITLNHDILVEKTLIENGHIFVDGFGDNDGDVRWFKPETYDSNVKVKLLKLHGSIDWYYVNGYPIVGKLTDNNLKVKMNAVGKLLEFSSKYPSVLTGLNKIQYYNYGMYTDIHYHFQRVLYEGNLIIMSGYGWGDDPINSRLMTWLDKKKENKLILLHKDPIEEIMNNSLILDRDFSYWSDNGKLKHIPKWLCECTVNEVMEACV